MYAGQVVETGDAHAISMRRVTRILRHCCVRCRNLLGQRTSGIVAWRCSRQVRPPDGCLLNPRCPYATDRCRAEERR